MFKNGFQTLNSSPCKILVTGGAGFIGSAFIRVLLTHTPHIILNVDKLTYAGRVENLSSVLPSPRYTFAQNDICDAGVIARLVQEFRPDKIIHFAAETHVDRSIAKPADFMQTNIIGTQILLDVAREYMQHAPEDFLFHFISTDEVYGDHGHDKISRWDENAPIHPSSPYSASKAAGEHLVMAYHRTYGVPNFITRSSNNYGPYQLADKLIPLVIDRCIKGQEIPLYGDGQQVRDWMHVDDHVRALYMCLVGARAGAVYNIGGNNEQSNIDVVTKICDMVDEILPVATPRRSLIKYVADRAGHDRRYGVSTAKITCDFGWSPQVDFDVGLRNVVLDFIKNKT